MENKKLQSKAADLLRGVLKPVSQVPNPGEEPKQAKEGEAPEAKPESATTNY
jgi:hypothetical protein